MTGDPIRVLPADDEPLFRDTRWLLVDVESGICVVTEAGTGREACALAIRHQIDVAVMDVRMPDMGGITTTAALTALPYAPKVLVLTTFDVDESVYEALRAGASGFTPSPQRLDGVTALEWEVLELINHL